MDKKILTFEVSKKIADAFTLAVSISEMDQNEVFENMAKQYTLEILNGMSSAGLTTNYVNNNYIYNNSRFNNANYEQSKVVKKVPIWARKLNQINSQIIRTYFLSEINGVASRSKMREYFLRANPDKSVYQFESNLASMSTDKANSHGHVFDFYGDEVHLSNEAKNVVLAHRDMFLM